MPKFEPLNGLKAFRLKKGLTTTDLGDSIGRSQSHYSKMERGESHLLLQDAVKISKVFKIKLDKIL